MPAHFVSPETESGQRDDDAEVPEPQGLGLEDVLQERDVDESELGEERDGQSEDEDPVGGEGSEEASVLQCRDEVEEDERGECLGVESVSIKAFVTRMGGID